MSQRICRSATTLTAAFRHTLNSHQLAALGLHALSLSRKRTDFGAVLPEPFCGGSLPEIVLRFSTRCLRLRSYLHIRVVRRRACQQSINRLPVEIHIEERCDVVSYCRHGSLHAHSAGL